MRIFPYLLIFASTTTCAQTVKAELQCRLSRTDYVYDNEDRVRFVRLPAPVAGRAPDAPASRSAPDVALSAGPEAGDRVKVPVIVSPDFATRPGSDDESACAARSA